MPERVERCDIDGWFDEDFRNLYAAQVARAQSPSTFVEIGCWKGKSAVAMARMIQASGKQIRFVAIDHCLGSPGDDEPTSGYGGCAPSSEEELRANLEGYAVELLVMKSVPAADLFEDGSADFVFIDGDHREAAVWADIQAWWPKVKIEGTLAGHDRGLPGVDAAVRRFVDEKRLRVVQNLSCWVIHR